MTVLRLGTRGSALATAQSGGVAATVLATLGRDVELVTVRTAGDDTTAAIAQLGATGVFVTALRDRLLDGSVDLAVHSMKDLPTAPADGLVVAAVPPREDPRDAVVARDGLTLAELGPGARIGTGSPRRAAQLRALGLDLEVVPVRGNVDTRVGFVRSGRLDAVVLARAGLLRLDRADEVTEVLEPIQMLPAPAQGVLALECRADDTELVALLALLEDPDARAASTAERTLLALLEGGCSAPVGALADVSEGDEGPELYLRGAVVAVDGSDEIRLSATGPAADPVGVARRLAADLLDRGAAELLAAPAARGETP